MVDPKKCFSPPFKRMEKARMTGSCFAFRPAISSALREAGAPEACNTHQSNSASEMVYWRNVEHAGCFAPMGATHGTGGTHVLEETRSFATRWQAQSAGPVAGGRDAARARGGQPGPLEAQSAAGGTPTGDNEAGGALHAGHLSHAQSAADQSDDASEHPGARDENEPAGHRCRHRTAGLDDQHADGDGAVLCRLASQWHLSGGSAAVHG